MILIWKCCLYMYARAFIGTYYTILYTDTYFTFLSHFLLDINSAHYANTICALMNANCIFFYPFLKYFTLKKKKTNCLISLQFISVKKNLKWMQYVYSVSQFWFYTFNSTLKHSWYTSFCIISNTKYWLVVCTFWPVNSWYNFAVVLI